MQGSVKKSWTDVDAQPGDGHDPDGVFENRNRKHGDRETGLLPGPAEEKVSRHQARQEQRERGMDAAALCRDLNVHPRQRELETVAQKRQPDPAKEELARI